MQMTCTHAHTNTHTHTDTLFLTALKEEREQVIPGIFTVYVGVAGEQHRGGGLGHADALFMRWLVLELVLVVLVTCEQGHTYWSPDPIKVIFSKTLSFKPFPICRCGTLHGSHCYCCISMCVKGRICDMTL